MSLLSRLAVQAARAYGVLSKGGVSASYLVVAGGGSGGMTSNSGGGGAGGYLTSTATLSTLNTYSITVGAGGASVSSVNANGNDGSNSVISGTGLTTITSIGGGGGGGSNNNNGRNGGSGGGGGYANGIGGSPTSGQGFRGGNGGGTPPSYSGGGGGGAGQAGGDSTGTVGSGVGGNGLSSSISGSSVTYAGGGGASNDTATSQAGGTGGGGAGGRSGSINGVAGTANLGGGGGGGFSLGISGAGGSGIVIISYASATPRFVGGTLTTSGGNQIHTFTSSGTLSPLTPVTASYLVVAGGGSGSTAIGFTEAAGGGGAGGLLSGSTTLYSGATYVVTVGAGGAGSGSYGQGNSGSDSVLSGTGITTVTSTGGGRGSGDGNGVNGGSGGGAGAASTVTRSGGTGTVGQGNNGGNGFPSATASLRSGGGGGGASAVGANGASAQGGAGGAGTASSITGSSVTYAAGGGGSSQSAGGSGGSSIGGNGQGLSPATSTTSGTVNRGAGGGGSTNGTSGSGGSGVVIISYAGSQVFNGGLVTSSGGNTIHTFNATGALTPLTNNLNNSLRFRQSASAYLSKTYSVSPTSTTKQTFSIWAKRGNLSTTQTLFSGSDGISGNPFEMNFTSGNVFSFLFGGAAANNVTTTAVFRDPSAWYHIVVAVDTTQATAANRIKIYINGNQVTVFSATNYPAQNATMQFALANANNKIGSWYSLTQHFDGYLADNNFIDGQALEPYYFGNNDANGVWKPIKYTGMYGTNGFYLPFSDTSALTTSSNVGLGKDFSGNGNYWTTNNISITAGTTYDAMLDVPTNTSATVANYCVLNPTRGSIVVSGNTYVNFTLSNANLTFSGAAANNAAQDTSIAVNSGKYYWEVIHTSVDNQTLSAGTYVRTNASETSVGRVSGVAYLKSGNKLVNDVSTAYGSSWTTSDVIGIALDLVNNEITYYKNNVSQGAISITVTDLCCPHLLKTNGTGTLDGSINFGQRPFTYTPPSGFVALNTFNLPTPTILQGNKYMDATTFTGTGVSNVIVNAGQFKPDFVWGKSRSLANSHILSNSVAGADKFLISNSTAAEATNAQAYASFNSNGFTLGTDTSLNSSGATNVAWQWQAGQGSTSSNTSGTITSTVSVSTTAGFSVVTYTGTGANATVGHGLGVAPSMIFTKTRSSAAGNWGVYHSAIGATKVLNLNLTNAAATSSTFWNNTAPTSSVFTVATSNDVNASATTYVAYCWAEIAGFSKFGSYTGNGSTDGPFVYLGFRPKYLMVKRTDSTGMWSLWDTSRNTFNSTNLLLQANTSDAETSGTFTNPFDLLSNGFKLRDTSLQINASGGTFIYMAFAENPFKNANAR